MEVVLPTNRMTFCISTDLQAARNPLADADHCGQQLSSSVILGRALLVEGHHRPVWVPLASCRGAVLPSADSVDSPNALRRFATIAGRRAAG
ncbi:MAG TPA: hypothetical protein VGX25_22355 [Actinophytocola sp.]|uniref:hypothetical protein n=1 Tax=Actinophytocola sp. TaxID=1872138 RepID=UPI002DDDBCB0|nr:hypothetical protein [Actinophytocola sp.]HEV2782144.1 hypothetical protein [Actinophytocola sp.]